MENEYIVYTDGGCAFNPGGPGAAASVILKDGGDPEQIVSSYAATTNNRMELTAVIQALEKIPEGAKVTLHSDSQYVLNCINGAWRKQKNTDLWALYKSVSKNKKIKTRWVRGHNGDRYNELCDSLCTEAMQCPSQEDTGYLAEKEAGREFFRKVDQYVSDSNSVNAMAVDIKLPEGYQEREPEYMSNNAYAKKWNVHTSCASAIQHFYALQDHSFKAYLGLKTGGIDFWSRKTADTILEGNSQAQLIKEIVGQALQDPKDRITVLRWYGRGLPLKDAIRKVLVDREVSENAIRSR